MHKAADVHLNILHFYYVPENNLIKKADYDLFFTCALFDFITCIADTWYTYSDP